MGRAAEDLDTGGRMSSTLPELNTELGRLEDRIRELRIEWSQIWRLISDLRDGDLDVEIAAQTVELGTP